MLAFRRRLFFVELGIDTLLTLAWLAFGWALALKTALLRPPPTNG